jgi:hypothetical protein
LLKFCFHALAVLAAYCAISFFTRRTADNSAIKLRLDLPVID